MNKSNPASDYTVEEDVFVIANTVGGVSQVSVSITLSTKALGADAFIKLEETYDFATPATDGEAVVRRSEMVDLLRDQVILEAKAVVDAVREAVASTPKGSVSIHPVQGYNNPGTQAAAPAPAFSGPQATVAVANGSPAPVAGGAQWMSVPSKFGDGELRFISTASYSTSQLESEVGNWLRQHAMNPDAFKVWDNRPGQKGLEAGVPNGCVAAVKISKDAQEFVTGEIANQAIARVKFNSNGSLYIWFTKEAEAAIKYGALNGVKLEA
jgi:hypothetical protein